MLACGALRHAAVMRGQRCWFRGRSAVPAKRAIGVCRRTGSDNLETCHYEKIHGEKFCRHASDATEEMKENLRKEDEEERRIVDKGVKLGRPAPGRVKIDYVWLSYILYAASRYRLIDLGKFVGNDNEGVWIHPQSAIQVDLQT